VGELQAVVDEFERVLRGPVPPSADFFALGGTSLLAVRVVAGVTARTGRLLTLVDLLRLRTPEAVAGHLADAPAARGWMPPAAGAADTAGAGAGAAGAAGVVGEASRGG